jgi:hypothetical protein
VGLRAGLDRCGKSRYTEIRSPDRPARRHSLYRLRYPAPKLHNKVIQFIGVANMSTSEIFTPFLLAGVGLCFCLFNQDHKIIIHLMFVE